jgi:hypothetical protein
LIPGHSGSYNPCGSFAFFVAHAGVLKEGNMTLGGNFCLEAGAVAQHLPET